MRRLIKSLILLWIYFWFAALESAAQTPDNPPPSNSTPSLAVRPAPKTLGAFKANSSGSAGYTVPISVPPGTAGMAPNIALAYDSRAENDLLGVGWSLSGLSSVHRCPATVAQDGFQGGINYDSNDRFCLDGQRLMAVSGVYGGDGTEYRTEIDASVKVISYGAAGSGPASFRVWTKAGQLMEFGNTTDSRIEAQGKASVRVWALNKIQDTSGNYLTVSYFEDNTNGEYRPTRIDYTGNTAGGLTPNRSVQFSYAARPDVVPQYEGGSLVKTTVRLTNVQTYVGTTLVRDYRLTYETGPATGRSRLTSITQCGGDGSCLPANTFSWQEGGSGFVPSSVWSRGYFDAAWMTFAADVNGDGMADYFTADGGSLIVKLSTGAGFTTDQVWGTYTHDGDFKIGDFNGDGKVDCISFDTKANLLVYLSTGSGFLAPQVWGTGTTDFIADFNGDGLMDIAYLSSGNIYVKLSTGSSFTASQVWGTVSPFGGHKIGDFNGDGKADLLHEDNSSNLWVYLSIGSSFATPQLWGTGAATLIADFNGDGLMDIVHPNGGNIQVKLSTGTGFTTNQVWGTYTGTGNPRIGDFNGDGKADYLYENAGNVSVYISTGSDFTAPQVWGTGHSNFSLIADFNGDGKDDHAYAIFAEWNIYVKIAAGPFSDLLTTLRNGLGGQTSITYKPITDSTVYAKDNDAVYPVMDLQTSLYVVASRTVSDGRGGKLPVYLPVWWLQSSSFGKGRARISLDGGGGEFQRGKEYHLFQPELPPYGHR